MITALKKRLAATGIDFCMSDEDTTITISWNTHNIYDPNASRPIKGISIDDLYALIEASLTKEYAIDTFSIKDGIATLMTKQAIIQRHDDRQISVKEVLKRQADGVVDPCVYCGESTAFGHGRFVNRVPADRQCFEDDEGYVDGYACDECMTPPFCEICGMNPPQESHFRCDECEEAEWSNHDMLDS